MFIPLWIVLAVGGGAWYLHHTHKTVKIEQKAPKQEVPKAPPDSKKPESPKTSDPK